jgi:hypothetical protein
MTSVTTVASRLVIVVAAALVPAACAGGDDDGGAGSVPDEVSAFVDRIADPGATPFAATYSVLQKYGGATSTVDVAVTPPSWQVQVDDVVATGGPHPRTCSGTPQECVDDLQEARLAPHGITSGFFATPTGQALADRARQSDAEPTFSNRTEAGVELDCATVADRTVCITDDGVVGLIDDASRRVVLTSYVSSR